MSSTPVTAAIPTDLETEHEKRETHKRNPSVKLPKSMRTDVAIFYKDGPGDVFGSPEPKVETKAALSPAALPSSPTQRTNPPGRVESTMKAYANYLSSRAYPPNDALGFWTQDTCYMKSNPCDASSKHVRVFFNFA
eukprot:CAMPEP_0168467828 /NCGR_PEP_ID=MMETSP0228-20121227/57391_1 /TAXON_ID=133427 /ORGANISM="Protoceratium reticulatum, Strain CCCM 535 (=CCMP 1889)" /LENGTH=135 /DNA_ID=CAMNT_0008483565 /DNA_START=78 /DNA_END=481 /DNA_ORIENTATION=-